MQVSHNQELNQVTPFAFLIAIDEFEDRPSVTAWASSISVPRLRPVLSIFVRPRKSCRAHGFPAYR